jgi:hypothetical protein
MEPAEGMLFVELEKAMGDWLWHNDRIDNKSELVPSYLGEFVVVIRWCPLHYVIHFSR